MNSFHSDRRRLLRNAAGLATFASAVMLVVSAVFVLRADALPAGTAPVGGQTMTPSSGNSSTAFELSLTSPNNTCPGDTATDGYRWSTYIVPASVDPATLTYNASGPIAPSGVAVTQPLYSANGGSPQVNKNTAVTTGLITGVATMSFAVFPSGFLTPGDYRIGFACVLNGATERYWMTTITVATAADGGPAQITYAPAAVQETTTTTSSTTTSSSTTSTTSTTTTTTVAGATTSSSTSTSVAGVATTTSVVSGGATTTSTTVLGSSSTTAGGTGGPVPFTPGSSGSGSGGQTLVVTGSSPVPIAVWAVLLLIFGRMTILLARPVRVVPPEAP